MRFYTVIFSFVAFLLSIRNATAAPWAEPGNAQLRSDVEVLSSARLVDGITTQWPLPWASLEARLESAPAAQSDMLRAAIRRVRSAALGQHPTGQVVAGFDASATNEPSVVRVFDALGRQTLQGQSLIQYASSSTFVQLAIGAQSQGRGDRQTLVLDNSYVAQKLGGAVVYAGYLPHWWGPGWISALSLSTNARPMPQIGIARASTAAFESPWFSWIGPWQAEFLVGVLDGPRISENTLYSGLHVTANPLPGLEMGLARTQMFCGKGHQCKPIAGYFNLSNDLKVTNYVNEEGVFDIRYTTVLTGQPVAFYTQLMNEDSSPFAHSGTSHLFGATTWLEVADGTLRLTLEYTDTIPTFDIFSFGNVMHGFAYNNGDYIDGMRYRGKTLGASLDSDSRLASLQMSYIDVSDWTYSFTYHRAQISTPQNPGGNIVTILPVTINLAEARIRIPFEKVSLEIAGRIQDDQPRPRRGFTAAAEISAAYLF